MNPTAMYNELLHYGHIEPNLTQFEKQFFDKHNNPLEGITDTDRLSIAYNSKTASRRDFSFPAYRPQENWKRGDTVELARMPIPSGNLGVLTRIDTLVKDDTTGEAISKWNNPDSWDQVFRFVVSYNHPGDIPHMTNRRIRIPAIASPDAEWLKWIQSTPLYPLLSWEDDRYAWGNPSNDIGVVLPKQVIVRLFVCCVTNTEFRHQIRGRLVSTIQTENSIAARWRARRGEIG